MTPEHWHYCIKAKLQDFTCPSQLVLLPNAKAFEMIEDYANSHQHITLLHLSSFVTESQFFPAADVVFSAVANSIHEENVLGNRAVIWGLDGLLGLWDHSNVLQAYTEIRNLLDNRNLRFFIFLTGQHEIPVEVFANPRYKPQIVNISSHERVEDSEDDRSPNIKLLDHGFSHWKLIGQTYPSFKLYLSDAERNVFNDRNICIFTTAHAYPLANIHERLPQISGKQEFMEQFCNLHDTLTGKQLDWLFAKMNGNCTAVLPFLQQYFFANSFSQEMMCLSAPKLMAEVFGTEREMLLWTLRNSISKTSYLKEVLNDSQITATNFLKGYVCKAVELWDSPLAAEYAHERREALKPIQYLVVSDLAFCLEQFKQITDLRACQWFNCETNAEKAEMLRRYMETPSVEIPHSIRENYPLFDAYLQPYNLGISAINQYFEKYRLQKLKNMIQDEFCSQAKDITYPPTGILSRAELLKGYSPDQQTLLFSIDALGAEYLPAILKLAEKYRLPVEKAAIAYVNLPTSTEFNQLEWPKSGNHLDFKQLDDIIHHGDATAPIKHEQGNKDAPKYLPQDNIVLMLNTLEEIISKDLSKELAKYQTVILTSDHGASRLAVLAYEAKKVKTFAHFGAQQPDDWRYTKAVPDHTVPDGTIAPLSSDYWVIKGYNRFGKSGWKFNEMHGGLTWEEVLVPFVVFRQDNSFQPTSVPKAPSADAFENDPDFDI